MHENLPSHAYTAVNPRKTSRANFALGTQLTIGLGLLPVFICEPYLVVISTVTLVVLPPLIHLTRHKPQNRKYITYRNDATGNMHQNW